MNIRFQIPNMRRFISEPQNTGPAGFFLVCLLSLICHALFFICLYFLHNFEFSVPRPKVVTVNLVTFAPGSGNVQTLEKSYGPGKSASGKTGKGRPDAVSQIPSKPAEPREPEIPIIKPEGSLKSKPDNLKDLIAAREKEPPKKQPPKEKLVEKKNEQEEKAKKKKLEQDLAKAKKEQAEEKNRQEEKAKKKN